MPTFLFVPGAWLGGWCWRDVAPHLHAGGHTAIFATLTGLGERAHLLSRQIGLQTHIADIVGLLHYRDLNGVTLVGHSYGGTVVTAVAEQVPERIRGLVYLDASVPQDGESNNDVIGSEMAAQLRSSAMSGGEGWRVPPARYVGERLSDAIRPWVEARLTPIRYAASTSRCSFARAPPPHCRGRSFERPCNLNSTRGSSTEPVRRDGTAAISRADTIRC
jgi:pimeloyl-ACP methyl ester carboxylesterase